VSFAILTLKRVGSTRSPHVWFKAAMDSSHLLLGGVLAMAAIVLKMHVLLPDTAVAKSHGIGIWNRVPISAAHAIVGGMSLGAGMLLFWLLTFFLLLRSRRISLPLLLANAVFPLTMALAILRGQEIQGIRYLAWTLLFSILWNILELGIATPDNGRIEQDAFGRILTYVLLALLLTAQPFEALLIYPLMTARAKLMASVPHRHLDVLQGKRGIAADVGIIGYFSKANICDISGLVDGRDFARLNSQERMLACAASKPDFLFFSRNQLAHFNEFFPAGDWQICGAFEMPDVHSNDTHYLVVPPATSERICKETSGSRPYSVTQLIALGSPTTAALPKSAP
jgi:hypothetical protein